MILELTAYLTSMAMPLVLAVGIMAVTCGWIVKEMSGSWFYGVVSMPILLVAGIVGHAFLQQRGLIFGVDPVTDTLAGSAIGMIGAIFTCIFVRTCVQIFSAQR
ncbi:MAG: hypothetical protein ACFCUN_07340 [Hyphomicrobiaceae bacterium]